MRYELDPGCAKRVGTAPRITETGAYVGTIYDCFQYATASGAQMIRIEFTSDDERRASIDLCVQKKDGSDAFGLNIFHAILAVCKMRSATGTKVPNVPLFGKKVTVERFHEMMNKRIGLLLQKTTDLSRDRYQDSLAIACPFNADTRQTAREMLEQKDAVMLDKLVASTKDRVTGNPAAHKSNPAVEFESQERAESAPLNDDIPF
jgi:hypothetical protein